MWARRHGGTLVDAKEVESWPPFLPGSRTLRLTAARSAVDLSFPRCGWRSRSASSGWSCWSPRCIEPEHATSSSDGMSFTRIPSAIILGFFAWLATWVIARHGFVRRDDDLSPAPPPMSATETEPALQSLHRRRVRQHPLRLRRRGARPPARGRHRRPTDRGVHLLGTRQRDRVRATGRAGSGAAGGRGGRDGPSANVVLDGFERWEPTVYASEPAARGLHEVADHAGAELIVVGSTHRHGLGRVMPGTTGERLLHGSACPLAIAPAGWRGDAIETIGAGFDGSPESLAALAAAATLADASGAFAPRVQRLRATQSGEPGLCRHGPRIHGDHGRAPRHPASPARPGA